VPELTGDLSVLMAAQFSQVFCCFIKMSLN
jgi:hypothetical protein